jgi:hypothetical protein
MWKWPLGVFLAGVLMMAAALPLGYGFDDPDGESGAAAILTGIAGVLYVLALLTVPLGLFLLGAMATHRPVSEQIHTWRAVVATLGVLAWLFFCFVLWLAAHTGGGGLDGPCEPGAPEHPGTCRTEIVEWPPLSTHVVVDGPDGHFDQLYPTTVGLIGIVSLALLPFVLWPTAKWVTSPKREGRIPLRRMALLGLSATGVALLYSAVVDDNTSRPLTADERVALANEEGDRGPARPAFSGPPPGPRIVPTLVAPEAIESLVSAERGGGRTRCATSASTGIGLWACSTITHDGSVFPARLTVSSDGSYAGKYVNHHGVEQPIRGCCVAVTSGTEVG